MAEVTRRCHVTKVTNPFLCITFGSTRSSQPRVALLYLYILVIRVGLATSEGGQRPCIHSSQTHQNLYTLFVYLLPFSLCLHSKGSRVHSKFESVKISEIH